MHRVGLALILVTSVAYAQPTPDAPPGAPDAPKEKEAPPPETPPTPAPGPTTHEATTTAPVLVAAPAPAEQPAEKPPEKWTLRAGGYLQVQARTRQNSTAADDEDGFRIARVRPTLVGEGETLGYKLGATLEIEAERNFALADAYATIAKPLANNGNVALDLGQTRVPISRQNLMSDSRLSFIDKGQIAIKWQSKGESLTPDRDLGARAWFIPPGLPQVRVIAGMFNGEGKNQVQNINESYLYAGRVEITPFGGPQPYQESAFVKPFVSLGLSVGHNKLSPGDYHENRTILGADLSGVYKGLSGSIEYLRVSYKFDGDPAKLPGPDYVGNGWLAQVAYLMNGHFEVAARVEEVDRNDTVGIPQLADPAQSIREYEGVLSAYLRQHTCKAQLSFMHFQEIEDKTATGLPATFDNDQVVLQITYRVE